VPTLGLIFGIVYKTKKYPVSRGASTAGIVLNGIAFFISLVMSIMIAFAVGDFFNNMDYYSENYPDEYSQFEQYFEEYEDYYDDY
jgi:predicted nucleotide-binding protein (sugar kinase/HSP70/actin superfamily)